MNSTECADAFEKMMNPEFLTANPDIAVKIFDQLLLEIGDSNPELRTTTSLFRAWFGSAEARKQITDMLWDLYVEGEHNDKNN